MGHKAAKEDRGEVQPGAFWQKNKTLIIADLSLVLVALVWGGNFVIMKDALERITPFAYLGVRFLLATFFLAAGFWRSLLKTRLDDLRCGLLAGFLLFAGFATQTVGLMYTTPARSVFALVFSYYFWGEAFSLPRAFGIILIFTGILITVLMPGITLTRPSGGITAQQDE